MLVARGRSSKDIALRLGVSVAGANFHVLNAIKKLGAANRAHAVALAIADGILPLRVARSDDAARP